MDPRHRAPFAHQSSSVDLRRFGQSQSPPRSTWPLAPAANGGSANGHHLAPPGAANNNNGLLNGNGIHLNGNGAAGGPGYFAPSPPAGPSRLSQLTGAAAGLFNGLKMERKVSDVDYNEKSSGIANGLLGNGSGHAHAHSHGLGLGNSGHGHGLGHGLNRMSLSGLGRDLTDAENMQRIQSALPTPSTVRFVLLCTLWYAASAVSSNTGKVILNNFRFPVTLTIVQFAFVAGLCWLGSRRELNFTARLRKPTKQILTHTLPMAAFQVGGHIFGSLAMSRVPVSTVHTIKALSPLFTVLAYAFLFGVSYSPATYLSLLPLTLGVMLACSFDISLSNVLGLVCAFGSTIVFVSQNIFFKKVMPSPGAQNADAHAGPRLDKINLLYFSSGMAFLLMIPIWLYSDAYRVVSLWFNPAAATNSASVSTVVLYFFINGTVHFAQNVLAFAILSSTSPVTYSIASLVKRIAVICIAIVWFKQAVHGVQAVGIMLTAVGLYMYNNAKRDVEKGEKRVRALEAARDGMLPTSRAEARILDGRDTPTPEPYLNEKAHASPRPTYNGNTFTVQKASALRPQYAPPRKSAQVPVAAEPYPSPPASTASSPPLPPSHMGDEPRSPVALPTGA